MPRNLGFLETFPVLAALPTSSGSGRIVTLSTDGHPYFDHSTGWLRVDVQASAGGSALDANGNLVLPAPTAVTTPAAGAIAERVITRAGFSQLAYGNADTADLFAMPSLENYSFNKMEANGQNAMTTYGCSAFLSGSVSGTSRTNTTYSNSRDSLLISTSTTAGTASYNQAQISSRIRGNAARRGGFFTVIRFNPVLLTGHQASVGMYTSVAALAGEPSADSSAMIGMICDSTDTTWQIFCKPSGVAGTKISTAVSTTTTGPMLALYLYSAPFGAGIQYQIENEEAQTVITSGTMTLTLPAATTAFIGLGTRVRNGATVTSASIALYSASSASRY